MVKAIIKGKTINFKGIFHPYNVDKNHNVIYPTIDKLYPNFERNLY